VGPSIHHVGIDNVSSAAAATDYLLARGRRRIAAVGRQDDGASATSQLRYQGYEEALARAGLAVDPALIGVVDDFNRAAGSRAVQELLDRGVAFDGLLCFSDTLALGALYTLGSNRIPVPDQVEVMGFDGIEEGRFHVPGFATVNPGVDEAADIILDIIAAPQTHPGAHHNVPYTIISA
ncbi:MAG: substrate-binding domain-containing protein, partial [Propioniciclava sp.]